MTLADFLLGRWTFGQLLRDLLPLVALGIGAFLAGYARGWNQGFVRGTGLTKEHHD